MRRMSSVACSMVFLLALGWGCSAAPDGFNAPFGSTGTLPDDSSLIAPNGALVQTSVSVVIPGPKGTAVPGNNVYVVFTCFNCTILDTPNGGGSLDADDLSNLEAKANPYGVATNSRGQYNLVVQLPAPAELGVESYEAQLGVDLGVPGGSTSKFSVSQE